MLMGSISNSSKEATKGMMWYMLALQAMELSAMIWMSQHELENRCTHRTSRTDAAIRANQDCNSKLGVNQAMAPQATNEATAIVLAAAPAFHVLETCVRWTAIKYVASLHEAVSESLLVLFQKTLHTTPIPIAGTHARTPYGNRSNNSDAIQHRSSDAKNHPVQGRMLKVPCHSRDPNVSVHKPSSSTESAQTLTLSRNRLG
mmetsp:Transcript_154894/g.496331  ORF Transcript_154894/g.496331 Transcript_154894/m.496331 type:complete len:202 (-) Transcript_154894:252-857(-)